MKGHLLYNHWQANAIREKQAKRAAKPRKARRVQYTKECAVCSEVFITRSTTRIHCDQQNNPRYR